MVSIVIYNIVGTSPILMNNAESMKRPPGGIEVKKIPSAEDEAAAKVYRLEDGTLYAPAMWFRAAVLVGAVGRRIGKVSAKGRLAASVFCPEPHCPLLHQKTGKPIKDYKINVGRAVVQKAGVFRARPEIADWKCRLPFEVDEDFVSPKMLLEFLNLAGKIAGVGDWRPQKSGPYGRFTATQENGKV